MLVVGYRYLSFRKYAATGSALRFPGGCSRVRLGNFNGR